MIKTELCDGTDILFCDKRFEVLFIENRILRDPSAKIDALLKSFKNPHTFSPFV